MECVVVRSKQVISETYVSNRVYFVFDSQFTHPLIVMVGKAVNEGNGSLLFVMLCCEYKKNRGQVFLTKFVLYAI
jgi:hypothetical protein